MMTYDAIGPAWGVAGDEHSPHSMAVSNINTWKSCGVVANNLVLGLPFYGYGYGSYNSDYGIDVIVSTFGASAAQQDVIGTRCAGCSYI